MIDFEGAIVVVSHDRHLLRSTTDEFYLVYDQQVEPFDGDLDDYQKWLNNDQKALKKSDLEFINPIVENLTSQEKKELKRKEAEFRAQMQPLKKALQQAEKLIEQFNLSLTMIEQQLVDPQIYEPQNKAKLTDLLKQQRQIKSNLEEEELNWLDIQQQLDHFEAKL